MTEYRMKAEAGAYGVKGQDADLRHVAPLPNDHPLLIKLGSVSSNHADIEWHLREIIEMLDTAPEKPLVKKIARANQLEIIGKVFLEGLASREIEEATQMRAHVLLGELLTIQEERNRLQHDPWRADKKTGELVQFRTRGADKLVVVPESSVDEVVEGYRLLRVQVVEFHAAIWKRMNQS